MQNNEIPIIKEIATSKVVIMNYTKNFSLIFKNYVLTL